jgi:tetratricopeptide (TPR) repeat protein
LAHGLFQYWFCNFDEARAVYAESQKKFESTGNERGLVRVYWQRGYIEDDVDNCSKAEELYRKGLELSLQIGDKRLISISNELVGVVLYHRGKYQEARSYLLESLNESISRQDNAAIARAKRRLASVARQLAATSPQPLYNKYVVEARTLLEDSLKIERNQWGVARLHRQLGLLEQFLQDNNRAKEHFTHSLEIFRILGTKKGVAAALYNLGIILESEGDLDGAEKCYLESMAIGRVISRRSGIALSLIQLASIAHKRGDLRRSVELSAQAVDILSSLESMHLETAKGLLEKVTADYTRQQEIEDANLAKPGDSDGRPSGA